MKNYIIAILLALLIVFVGIKIFLYICENWTVIDKKLTESFSKEEYEDEHYLYEWERPPQEELETVYSYWASQPGIKPSWWYECEF